MSKTPDWPRIAVVGAGAVGGYFGGMFARAGAPTVFVGRRHFADAVNSRGLVLDKSEGQERMRVRATTEMSAVRDCSLILFCVKANDTQETANRMAPFLRPDATVVCLQNGVDNADQVRAAASVVVLSAAVYVAVSMPEPGRVKHLARGDLIIGPPSERTTQVANLFISAGMSCRISDNIEGELWLKLLCNCGIRDRESGMAAALEIATQMAGALSSTAQDLDRGRPTEIDALNGCIARMGAKLGVPTPVNHALFTLVKLAEQKAVV